MRWCSVELAAAIALVAMAAPASSVHAQACHRGVVEDGAIVWRSTIARSSALVGALPDDVALESIEGGVARLEGGRVAGVDASGGAPIVIVTRQSIEEDGEVTLRPPLVSEPQRIVLTARQGSRVSFAPAQYASPACHRRGHGTQRQRSQVLLLRAGRRRHRDRPLHLSCRRHPHLRRRPLAQRKGHL